MKLKVEVTLHYCFVIFK